MEGLFAKLAATILFSIFAAVHCTVQAPADSEVSKATSIHINADKPLGYTVPRTIFGSFLEPDCQFHLWRPRSGCG